MGLPRSGEPPREPRISVDAVAEADALACIQRGDRDQALEILMSAYNQLIIAFAIRVVRDPELAKDIRQQVFLEAFQGFEKFQGRSSLCSWLCGITYHRCIDEIRRRRRTSLIDDFAVFPELEALPDPSMDPERAMQRRALDHCLEKLAPEVRAQVLMRFYWDWSFVEIGEAIGEPQGTIQVRMTRILPKLLRCLRGQGIDR